MNIIMIEAIFFCLLIDFKNQKQSVKCFFIIISQIDLIIKALHADSKSLEINVMIKDILKHEQVKSIRERIMKRVSKYFHDLFEAFDSQKVIELSSHRSYDHKIELLTNVDFLSRSRIYSLLAHKLQKLKKYLKKNLQRDFIASSKTLFVSSILFAVKFDDQLRLCVNYRRLNQLTKRNRYFILLVEESLTKIQNCKYLIRLNIISTFDKLRMNSKSEELITFVTFMRAYKYRVLSFDLVNDSVS